MADEDKDTRDRKTRLSAALRANLARRKQQARQRRAAGAPEPGRAEKPSESGITEPDPPKE